MGVESKNFSFGTTHLDLYAKMEFLIEVLQRVVMPHKTKALFVFIQQAK